MPTFCGHRVSLGIGRSVVYPGANSMSGNISWLYGLIPVTLNPAMTLFWAVSRGYALLTIPGMSYIVIF